MYIPNEIVNQIQAVASMELVLNHYGIITKGNGVTKGISCCPKCSKDFDDVKYNSAKELVNCFVCGFGGNVFNVIMIKEGCKFVEAVKICADIIGFDIPTNAPIKRDVFQEAAFFFTSQYTGQLEHRGISKETAKLFGVGYAPGGDKLVSFLRKRNFTDNEILSSGLAKVNDSGNLVDKYFKSAVFPDIRGKKVVDFYFRVLDDKYNVKHQLLKGKNNLIGHHMINGSKALALCEAPIDAASFYQLYNIPAISICGSWTKISNHLISLVRSLNLDQIILAFDNDESGRIATFELIHEFIGYGIEIVVLDLGSFKDINGMMLEKGVGSFEDGKYLYLKNIASNFEDETLKKLLKDRNIL